MHIVQHVFPMK